MSLYYSKSTNGFYDEKIHGKNKPSDCVEITREAYLFLFDGQSKGLPIVSDDSGYPTLGQGLAVDAEVLSERGWRDLELSRSDIELYKAQDSDNKAKGSVSAWREYRKVLRAWPGHKDFPNKEFRPVAPDV